MLCQRLQLATLHTMAIVAVGSLLCFAPLYALLPSAGFHDTAWKDIVVQALFQGVLIGIVSGLLYTRAVALLGASTTALFTAAVPCITALAGIWLLDEIPSPMVWTG
ncbi:MAG: EamA family transporter, partial [Burkholderiaceae bacterium]